MPALCQQCHERLGAGELLGGAKQFLGDRQLAPQVLPGRNRQAQRVDQELCRFQLVAPHHLRFEAPIEGFAVLTDHALRGLGVQLFGIQQDTIEIEDDVAEIGEEHRARLAQCPCRDEAFSGFEPQRALTRALSGAATSMKSRPAGSPN